MAPLVEVEMPPEGAEVVLTGPVIGTVRGYSIGLGQWMQSVDGPDTLIVGVVLEWIHIPPPPPAIP